MFEDLSIRSIFENYCATSFIHELTLPKIYKIKLDVSMKKNDHVMSTAFVEVIALCSGS